MDLCAVVARLVDLNGAVVAILGHVGDVAELLAVGLFALRNAGRRHVGAVLVDGYGVVLAARALPDDRPVVGALLVDGNVAARRIRLDDLDRKSTRLNSSH